MAPLLPQLLRADITDIYINRPGELWAETTGGATERIAAPDLDAEMLLRLARQIANITHQGISREHPLLAATLPDGSRVQVVAPPATRHAMAIAIRKHVAADLGLDDYVRGGAFAGTTAGSGVHVVQQELTRLHRAGEWATFLSRAVRARKSILISGGTSTGKTTFMSALMRVIDPKERLILIEDTPELQLRHENALGLIAVRGELGEARVTTSDLLAASLRMRPDRILLGELRGAEAFTFLRAVNTGHPGSMTTIHANSPEAAIEQLTLLVLQSGHHMLREDIVSYLRKVVDVVVQLERQGGVRRVSELSWSGEND